jgi:hypothetical protein
VEIALTADVAVAQGLDPPERASSKITDLLVAGSAKLAQVARVCKRTAYARSRNTATASTSKNWSAGTMATRFISQSGIFKITILKSGLEITSFFGWNTKDDDGDERPTRGCPRGRD